MTQARTTCKSSHFHVMATTLQVFSKCQHLTMIQRQRVTWWLQLKVRLGNKSQEWQTPTVWCSSRVAVKSRNCRSLKFENLPESKFWTRSKFWFWIKIKCVAAVIQWKSHKLVTSFFRLDVSPPSGLVLARSTSKTCWTFSHKILTNMVQLFCQMCFRKFWALTQNLRPFQATWQKSWSFSDRTQWLVTKEWSTQSMFRIELANRFDRWLLIFSSSTWASWKKKSFLLTEKSLDKIKIRIK